MSGDTKGKLVALNGGGGAEKPQVNKELVDNLSKLLKLAVDGKVQHAAIVVVGTGGLVTMSSMDDDDPVGPYLLHSATGVLYADLTDDLRGQE